MSDKTGKVHGIINGTWDEYIEYAPVESASNPSGSNKKAVLETGPPLSMWRVAPPSPAVEEAEKMYYFTPFAMQLNDSPSKEVNLAPTDSRLRPDQRLMEEGRWDEANAEKARLEDKQRARRREMALRLVNSGSQGNGSTESPGSSPQPQGSNVTIPPGIMGKLYLTK